MHRVHVSNLSKLKEVPPGGANISTEAAGHQSLHTRPFQASGYFVALRRLKLTFIH